jgi:uncharacterized RDD family membrane protein YckC
VNPSFLIERKGFITQNRPRPGFAPGLGLFNSTLLIDSIHMSAELTDPYAPPTASVERPQATGIRGFEFVGFGTRLMAVLLDSVIFFVGYIALFFVTLFFLTFEDPEELSFAFVMFSNLAPIAVILAFWTLLGGTPGKLMMGIRIVNIHTGKNVSIFRGLWRYVSYMISSFPLFFGFFWVLWDRENKAWHDHLSGTAVVRRR